jgi:hypothetical protein
MVSLLRLLRLYKPRKILTPVTLWVCVETTTVQVSTETWKALNRRREPGESFDDVLQSILEAENE